MNNIVWCYRTGGASKRKWASKHDVIFMYAKNIKQYKHNVQKVRSYVEQPADVIEKTYIKKAINSGVEGGINWWEYMSGNDLMKIYKDDHSGTYFTLVNARDWWVDIKAIGRYSQERTGYPTQKPLDLLKRIIKASSSEGDLVLDPFCGCVTTCIAAEILQRNWVGIDTAQEAWEQIKTRLKKDVPENLLQGEARLSTVVPIRGKEYVRPKKYVYVISNPAYRGMYKVGVATDVGARLNSYQTGDPKRGYKCEFAKETPVYKTLEPYIHRKFNGFGEWVSGHLTEIINVIENYRPGQADMLE